MCFFSYTFFFLLSPRAAHFRSNVPHGRSPSNCAAAGRVVARTSAIPRVWSTDASTVLPVLGPKKSISEESVRRGSRVEGARASAWFFALLVARRGKKNRSRRDSRVLARSWVTLDCRRSLTFVHNCLSKFPVLDFMIFQVSYILSLPGVDHRALLRKWNLRGIEKAWSKSQVKTKIVQKKSATATTVFPVNQK